MKQSLLEITFESFETCTVDNIGDVTWDVKCNDPKAPLVDSIDFTKDLMIEHGYTVLDTEVDGEAVTFRVQVRG